MVEREGLQRLLESYSVGIEGDGSLAGLVFHSLGYARVVVQGLAIP